MKYIIFVLLLLFSCEQALSPKKLVTKSISAHGLSGNHSIAFKFREKEYDVKRFNGEFKYRRFFKDTLDVLSNNGFSRSVDNRLINLSKADSAKYSESLNSVIYFSFLPLSLHDEAVHLKQLDDEFYKNENYFTLEVTFSEENGGTDFDDRFIYWINKESFLIDFFAYSYSVNGGGNRFRSVSNRHNLNDIILSDYGNYKFKNNSNKIDDYLSFY